MAQHGTAWPGCPLQHLTIHANMEWAIQPDRAMPHGLTDRDNRDALWPCISSFAIDHHSCLTQTPGAVPSKATHNAAIIVSRPCQPLERQRCSNHRYRHVHHLLHCTTSAAETTDMPGSLPLQSTPAPHPPGWPNTHAAVPLNQTAPSLTERPCPPTPQGSPTLVQPLPSQPPNTVQGFSLSSSTVPGNPSQSFSDSFTAGSLT